MILSSLACQMLDDHPPPSSAPSLLSTSVSIADAIDPNCPKPVMGFRDLLLFYVVSGISLRWIATAAAGGPSSVVVWIGAWFIFYTPLALSVIELSSRYPNEGGLYVWSKRAFGDFAGFMSAWTYWTANLPYFPAVLYFAFSNLLFVRHDKWIHLSNRPSFFIVFSLLALAGVTALNVIGLDIGKWLHNLGALAMWTPVLIVIAVGIVCWHRFGTATSFTLASMTPNLRLQDVIFWSTLTFALSGCEMASFLGGEIKNPRRAIPLALLTAGVTVTLSYTLGTIAVLLVLPTNQVNNLQGLIEAIYQGAQRTGLSVLIPIAAVFIVLSNLGAAGASLAGVARLPFVAGLDNFLPRAFGSLHPRWRTPWVALLTQFFFGAIFVFLGQAGTSVKGAYDVLVSMSVIATFLPFLYLFAAMFKLQREPTGPEVMRVPGGRIVARLVAVVGFCTTLVTIVISLLPPPDEPNKPLAVLKIVGLSALLVGIGVLLYVSGKRRAARELTTLSTREGMIEALDLEP